MKKLFSFVLIIVLLFSIGCSLIAIKPIKNVSVVGTPYVLSTYYTDGKFVLNVLALDGDSNPVELNSSNVKVIIDSVVDYYGEKATGFSVKVVDFEKITFKDGDMGLAMLFDGSGSMSSSDPNWLRKDAASKMIDYLASDRPNSMVGIFDFAVGYDTLYYFRTLQDFVQVGSNKTLLISALDSLANSGSTPLYDAMVLGCRKLEKDINSSDYNRILMTLTDGGDNDSYLLNSTAQSVLSEAKNSDVTLINIAFGDYAYTPDLLMLSDSTGGIFVKAQTAADLEDLFYQLGVGTKGSIQKITAQFMDSIPAYYSIVYGRVEIYKGLLPTLNVVSAPFEMSIGYSKGKLED
ncbi:MAG: vWA domain-containing protein [bacterium]|nr:vWA domain-containing protein [bacterium]